jgi:dihydropyrimidinase
VSAATLTGGLNSYTFLSGNWTLPSLPREVGADADVTIWNTGRKVTFGANDLHDATGYNPYAGRTITGWPETVLSRGEVMISKGQGFGVAGRGKRIPMARSAAMQSTREPEGAQLDYPG